MGLTKCLLVFLRFIIIPTVTSFFLFHVNGAKISLNDAIRRIKPSFTMYGYAYGYVGPCTAKCTAMHSYVRLCTAMTAMHGYKRLCMAM